MTPRQQEAVRLRTVERLTYRQIGARLGGVSSTRAQQLVKAGLKPPKPKPPPIPQEPLTDDAVWALFVLVDELETTVRTYNCLSRHDWSMPWGSVCLGDVAVLTAESLLSVRNFGKKSLADLQDGLGRFGLRLGMTLPGWRLLRQHGGRRLATEERAIVLCDTSAIRLLLGLNDNAQNGGE